MPCRFMGAVNPGKGVQAAGAKSRQLSSLPVTPETPSLHLTMEGEWKGSVLDPTAGWDAGLAGSHSETDRNDWEVKKLIKTAVPFLPASERAAAGFSQGLVPRAE